MSRNIITNVLLLLPGIRNNLKYFDYNTCVYCTILLIAQESSHSGHQTNTYFNVFMTLLGQISTFLPQT